ncbi:MAG: HDOD domain-containing protein [Pseudomonadota bacterium]
MRKALNNLLRRWFTQTETAPLKAGTASAETEPAVSETPATVPAPPAEKAALSVPETKLVADEQEIFVAWKPQVAVDATFFDWLMGYPGEGNSLEAEQKILQALFALLASDLNDAVVVPRVPTVIPQLLNSLRNKSVSAGELAQHIVKDVVLVGELINAVNSSLYNPADRINSLDKAIMILGEDGLRLLIAKVAFRPIINLNSGQYTRRAAPHIWNQSEKCAIACHHLAGKLDPFQAFLTGLMKNVGLIIAFRLLDQVCEEPRFRYSRSFALAFTSAAATLSYRVAQRWGFPPEVVQALQQQAGGSKAPNWTPLGHLLHTADLLSKMRVLVNRNQLKSGDERLMAGLNPQAIACFNSLNEINLYEQGGSGKTLLTE